MEWGFIILLVLAVPIVIIWPLIIWAGAISGIYQLVRNRIRGRANAHQAVAAAQKTDKR
jgi:hypothetical protein